MTTNDLGSQGFRALAVMALIKMPRGNHQSPQRNILIYQLHQPRLWFITGGYLVKRWFIPAAARARGQSNDLNREILASNLFNCHKEVINTPPVPSISRCIHIVYRHKNVWEYQWSNFIYNCMSTFLHYVNCKDALLDCGAPGGERYESLTWVDEINHHMGNSLGNTIWYTRPTSTGIPPSQVPWQLWLKQWLSINWVLVQSLKQCCYEKWWCETVS